MEWSKEFVAEALGVAGRDLIDEGFTIVPEYEEDTIHRFRVATKKLRALLRLVEASQPDEVSSKLPKKFKNLYSLSGDVRDGQLMTKRAAETEATDYADWLRQRTETAKEAFGTFYDSAILVKLGKKLRKIEPQPLALETLKAFFAERFTAIEGILAKEPLEEEDLHEIRKQVKDLQHISKIVKEYWPEGLDAAGITAALKGMEKLAQRAGDFNDQHNALVSLEAFMETTPPTAATQALYEAWEGEKNKDRQKLVEEITAFKEAGKSSLTA
ncbi:MAG: CHAD domain-containing protein [Sphingobacteriales bacterium]|nr:MAG: CHAD domain-containing protein [Sphingobacteriales bacterium]